MVGTRSIATAQLLVFFVCLIMLIQIWMDNKKRYQGIGLWSIGMGSIIGGFVLVALRDHIADFFSIFIGNTLILIGVGLFVIGLAAFLKAKKRYKIISILLSINVILLMCFTFVVPSISLRIIVMSAAYILFFLVALWMLIKNATSEFRSIILPLKVNSVIFILLNLVRIIGELFNPSQALDFFSQNIYEISFFTLGILVLLYLIINLAMLVPKKLLLDVKKEEYKFNTIFHFAPYGVIILKADDEKILEINNEMLELMKYTKEDVLGKKINNSKIWIDLEQPAKIIEDVKMGNEVNGLEIELIDKNGMTVYGLFSAVLINLEGEHIVICTLKDIGEIKKLKEELKDMATHDGLTNLPNRVQFYDYFEKQAARVSRSEDEQLAVVMMDLDSFKQVNDEYGHDMGDKVLIGTADKLTKFVRKGDIAARLGGDEFAILLNVRDKAEAVQAMSRLREIFSSPITAEGKEFIMSFSIGVAMYPVNGTKIDELLKKADAAMMAVKKSGKNAVRFAKE